MKPLKKPLTPFQSTMMIIGVVGASIVGAKIYQTPRGAAVDAMEYTHFVRDEATTFFKSQIPSLKGEFTLEVFRGARNTACGEASVRTGAFYCPTDNHVVLSLDFFDKLCTTYDACDIKQTRDNVFRYVIAHEVAHGVQRVTGHMKAHDLAWYETGQPRFNRESIKVELQADCLAGAYLGWQSKLNEVAFSHGMKAANALGDDIQRPDMTKEQYQHGTGVDRAAAFKRGFEAQNVNVCFAVENN